MESGALAFGRYVVRGHLGAGGMGQVLRAYDPKLDREVAIKIVKEPSSVAAARLLREALQVEKARRPTRPTGASRRRRLEQKRRRGALKNQRRRLPE